MYYSFEMDNADFSSRRVVFEMTSDFCHFELDRKRYSGKSFKLHQLHFKLVNFVLPDDIRSINISVI